MPSKGPSSRNRPKVLTIFPREVVRRLRDEHYSPFKLGEIRGTFNSLFPYFRFTAKACCLGKQKTTNFKNPIPNSFLGLKDELSDLHGL